MTDQEHATAISDARHLFMKSLEAAKDAGLTVKLSAYNEAFMFNNPIFHITVTRELIS
jgi:hypothetical protein